MKLGVGDGRTTC